MRDITRLLHQIDEGDPNAAERLLPLVYDELRRLAAAKMAEERSDHTLQATALVHEAYLRLVGSGNGAGWNSRGHFFGAAAEAMRRLLINRARDKARLKKGGHLQRVSLDQIELAESTPADNLLLIDDALQSLAEENPDCVEVVKMRFYAGLSLNEVATALGISTSTVKRHWSYARAWLFDALRERQETTIS